MKMSDYVIVPITNQMKIQAKNHYDFTILHNSFTKGRGNYVGAMGEIAFFKYIRDLLPNIKQLSFESTYNYDIIANALKLEIKSKKTSCIPKLHYSCNTTHVKQKCDYYIFTRCNLYKGEVYLLGYISSDEFKKQANFRKAGSFDPNDKKFKYLADGYFLDISELNPLSELVQLIQDK